MTLSGDDHIELLPAVWRTINDFGIQIDNRTYDSAELNPYRRQRSTVKSKGGLWEVHYDPHNVTHVWVRDETQHGWISVAWTHLPMVNAPFADYTWRHARKLVAERGSDSRSETAVAQALSESIAQEKAHQRRRWQPGA